LVSIGIAWLGPAVWPASAATTNIGSVTEIDQGDLPDPITAAAGDGFYTVQIGESAGTYERVR